MGIFDFMGAVFVAAGISASCLAARGLAQHDFSRELERRAEGAASANKWALVAAICFFIGALAWWVCALLS